MHANSYFDVPSNAASSLRFLVSFPMYSACRGREKKGNGQKNNLTVALYNSHVSHKRCVTRMLQDAFHVHNKEAFRVIEGEGKSAGSSLACARTRAIAVFGLQRMLHSAPSFLRKKEQGTKFLRACPVARSGWAGSSVRRGGAVTSQFVLSTEFTG